MHISPISEHRKSIQDHTFHQRANKLWMALPNSQPTPTRRCVLIRDGNRPEQRRVPVSGRKSGTWFGSVSVKLGLGFCCRGRRTKEKEQKLNVFWKFNWRFYGVGVAPCNITVGFSCKWFNGSYFSFIDVSLHGSIFFFYFLFVDFFWLHGNYFICRWDLILTQILFFFSNG